MEPKSKYNIESAPKKGKGTVKTGGDLRTGRK